VKSKGKEKNNTDASLGFSKQGDREKVELEERKADAKKGK